MLSCFSWWQRTDQTNFNTVNKKITKDWRIHSKTLLIYPIPPKRDLQILMYFGGWVYICSRASVIFILTVEDISFCQTWQCHCSIFNSWSYEIQALTLTLWKVHLYWFWQLITQVHRKLTFSSTLSNICADSLQIQSKDCERTYSYSPGLTCFQSSRRLKMIYCRLRTRNPLHEDCARCFYNTGKTTLDDMRRIEYVRCGV